MMAVVITFWYTPCLYAAESEMQTISWFFLCMGMLGGLALFLYGMEEMSTGLKRTAGNRMRSILAALTKNRVIAMFVGAVVTVVVQSSSATTVLLVSFVQAGLMTFVQSLGVILGADIGTTLTVQLIAFDVGQFALAFVFVGFVCIFFTKNPSVNYVGRILIGFGLLFYGLKVMGGSMKPLSISTSNALLPISGTLLLLLIEASIS